MPDLPATSIGNMRVEIGGGAVHLLIDVGNDTEIRIHMQPDEAARLSIALDDAVVAIADETDTNG